MLLEKVMVVRGLRSVCVCVLQVRFVFLNLTDFCCKKHLMDLSERVFFDTVQ